MKIDLQQIPFPHETFGLVICNHMLERATIRRQRCARCIGF